MSGAFDGIGDAVRVLLDDEFRMDSGNGGHDLFDAAPVVPVDDDGELVQPRLGGHVELMFEQRLAEKLEEEFVLGNREHSPADATAEEEHFHAVTSDRTAVTVRTPRSWSSAALAADCDSALTRISGSVPLALISIQESS